MTVTNKAASSSFSPGKVASTKNMSGSRGGSGAVTYDSAKQSKPHTVSRSSANAHTGSASASTATSVYRSSQKK